MFDPHITSLEVMFSSVFRDENTFILKEVKCHVQELCSYYVAVVLLEPRPVCLKSPLSFLQIKYMLHSTIMDFYIPVQE